MKRGVVCLVMMSFFSVCSAQTFAEWFDQKKTQIRYLTEQLAALRAYSAVVNKGYEIAKSGLGNISQRKGDDYSQHDAYFFSLATVKAAVRRHSKVRSIISMQKDVAKIYDGVSSENEAMLTPDEKKYVEDVLRNVALRSEDLLSELHYTIADRTLEMKDDERIGRIEKIYNDMLECKTFSRGFADRTKLLAVARRKEKQAIDQMQKSYKVK
jgi:hypothetical protein